MDNYLKYFNNPRYFLFIFNPSNLLFQKNIFIWLKNINLFIIIEFPNSKYLYYDILDYFFQFQKEFSLLK